MNEIIQKLLASQGPSLVTDLAGKLGIDAGKAEGFLGGALSKIGELVSGGFDVSSLLGGDAADQITSKIDVAALASETGVDPEQARTGLQTLIPKVLESLGGDGGASGLLGELGGEDGLLGKASKFLG